jgi:hypothetical protein
LALFIGHIREFADTNAKRAGGEIECTIGHLYGAQTHTRSG